MPTGTTQHTAVLSHPSSVPGERFTPVLPAGECSFPSARHSTASQSLLAIPGQSCPHTSPEQCSKRHRGAGGYQGRHRGNVLLSFQGVGTFEVHCLLAHVARKATFLPEGNDPDCRRDYSTHRVLSKAQTQEPQVTPQPVKQQCGG